MAHRLHLMLINSCIQLFFYNHATLFFPKQPITNNQQPSKHRLVKPFEIQHPSWKRVIQEGPVSWQQHVWYRVAQRERVSLSHSLAKDRPVPEAAVRRDVT